MKEKTKLKLEEIKIQSFVTSINEDTLKGIFGASDADVCNTEVCDTEFDTCDQMATKVWPVCTNQGGACDTYGSNCICPGF